MCADLNPQEPPLKTIFFNIRLEPGMHARIVELARSNERTASGEIRAALRQWIADAAKEAAA